MATQYIHMALLTLGATGTLAYSGPSGAHLLRFTPRKVILNSKGVIVIEQSTCAVAPTESVT